MKAEIKLMKHRTASWSELDADRDSSAILTAMLVSESNKELARLADEGWQGGDWWNHYASRPLYTICPWVDSAAMADVEQLAFEIAWDNLMETEEPKALEEFLTERGYEALDWDDEAMIDEWEAFRDSHFEEVNSYWHMEGWSDTVFYRVIDAIGLDFVASHYDNITGKQYYRLTDYVEVCAGDPDWEPFYRNDPSYNEFSVPEYMKHRYGVEFRDARIDALLAD